jgi:hypothetical protein
VCVADARQRDFGPLLRPLCNYFALIVRAIFAHCPISPFVTTALRPSDQVLSTRLSFATACNEYVIAARVLPDVKIFTLPLGLKMFRATISTQWEVDAAGVLVSVLVVLLFLMLSGSDLPSQFGRSEA